MANRWLLMAVLSVCLLLLSGCFFSAFGTPKPKQEVDIIVNEDGSWAVSPKESVEPITDVNSGNGSIGDEEKSLNENNEEKESAYQIALRFVRDVEEENVDEWSLLLSQNYIHRMIENSEIEHTGEVDAEPDESTKEYIIRKNHIRKLKEAYFLKPIEINEIERSVVEIESRVYEVSLKRPFIQGYDEIHKFILVSEGSSWKVDNYEYLID